MSGLERKIHRNSDAFVSKAQKKGSVNKSYIFEEDFEDYVGVQRTKILHATKGWRVFRKYV